MKLYPEATLVQMKLYPEEILCALYNNSRPQGMGFLHYDPTPMCEDEAREFLEGQPQRDGYVYFDYLKGRVLKMRIPMRGCELGELDFRLYDRDNGNGAGARAVTKYRQED